MLKNTPVAYFPIGRFTLITDGSEAITGSVSGTYSADATAGAIAGTPTYDATAKQWKVALLAAETNGLWLGLNFTLAGCQPIHHTIETDTKKVGTLNDSPYNGGAVASVTGAVASVTAPVTISMSQILSAPRVVDGVADNAMTVGDAFWASVVQSWGKWFKTGLSLLLKTPAGTLTRTLTLDDATNPSSRS